MQQEQKQKQTAKPAAKKVVEVKKEEPKPVPKEEPKPSARKVSKLDGSKEQHDWINYAYERCGADCVKTWQAESDWILLRPGNQKNSAGKLKGTLDMGLCQMNWQFHFDFIFDLSQSDLLRDLSPAKIDEYRRSWNFTNRTMYNRLQKELDLLYSKKAYSASFKDPYQQLNRCIGIWNDAKKKGTLKTTFYAYNVRNSAGVLKALTFH